MTTKLHAPPTQRVPDWRAYLTDSMSPLVNSLPVLILIAVLIGIYIEYRQRRQAATQSQR